MPRHGDAVAARFGEPGEPLLHRGGSLRAVEAGERRRLLLHQPRPQLGPVFPRAQLQQIGPDQPVHVGAGETPDGEHVGDRPGLALKAEDGEIVRQFGDAVLVTVDAVDEAAHPEQCSLVHAALDLGGGAAVGQDAQAAVDLGARRPDHLGQPPARQHARGGDLAEPQMRMHEAEHERRVAVAVGLDEGNLPLVPVDRRAPLQLQAARRERLEATGEVRPPGQRRQQRAGGERERRRDGRDTGGHPVLRFGMLRR